MRQAVGLTTLTDKGDLMAYFCCTDQTTKDVFMKFRELFFGNKGDCKVKDDEPNEFYGVPEDIEKCGDWKHSQFTYKGKDIDRYSKWVEINHCDKAISGPSICKVKWHLIEAWRERDHLDSSWKYASYFMDLYDASGTFIPEDPYTAWLYNQAVATVTGYKDEWVQYKPPEKKALMKKGWGL